MTPGIAQQPQRLLFQRVGRPYIIAPVRLLSGRSSNTLQRRPLLLAVTTPVLPVGGCEAAEGVGRGGAVRVQRVRGRRFRVCGAAPARPRWLE